MGSLTKVMQKLDEAEASAPPAETVLSDVAASGFPADDTPVDVSPSGEPPAPDDAGAALVDAAMAADAGPDPVATGFVAEPIAPAPARPSAPRDPLFDSRTQPWDAARIDAALIAFHDRHCAATEQYRNLRARLLAMNTGRLPQVIAITSSVPEEGKSVTSINLALAMAEGGEHRVLIADMDFRRSSLARMLGQGPSPGLCDVLRGEILLAEAIRPTPYANLKFLAAGEPRDRSYGELLGSPGLASILEELRLAFNYTFVDTPPVTTVSDVCLLGPHCDGALLVIEMQRTPEPTVQQAVRTLSANNVKVLGCVLSRFRDRTTGYYARYYSSYYYGR